MPTTVMVAMDVHVGVCSNPNIVSGYMQILMSTPLQTLRIQYTITTWRARGEVYEYLRQFSSFSS